MPLSMYAESDIGQETVEREGDYRGRKWSGCRLSADSIARQEIQKSKVNNASRYNSKSPKEAECALNHGTI